jgi:hypothetical protein
VAFAPLEAGILQLRKVLTNTGWIVHIHRPLLAEPQGKVEYHRRSPLRQATLTLDLAIALLLVPEFLDGHT